MWKEEFDTLYGRQLHDVWGVSNTEIEVITHYISTQLEKLIDEIPDEVDTDPWPNSVDLDGIKQQLRDKWL